MGTTIVKTLKTISCIASWFLTLIMFLYLQFFILVDMGGVGYTVSRSSSIILGVMMAAILIGIIPYIARTVREVWKPEDDSH